ncbi:AlpA family phage regulatory protein [Paracoccus sp. T5]|uniref:AlpA family phage regulatory protein n=1 Tax=Paracoccus sp. T5 TaxID=3402161 RepID=UPI003ADF304E
MTSQTSGRRRAVEELPGLSRSTIYDLMGKGQFPRPVNLTGRRSAGLKALFMLGGTAAHRISKPPPLWLGAVTVVCVAVVRP